MPASAPFGAGRDLAHVVVVADAHEDDVGALAASAGVSREAAAMLLGPGLRLGGGAVIDRDLVAVLGEMPRHRIAHDAQTQKRQLHVAPRPFQAVAAVAVNGLPSRCEFERHGLAGRSACPALGMSPVTAERLRVDREQDSRPVLTPRVSAGDRGTMPGRTIDAARRPGVRVRRRAR